MQPEQLRYLFDLLERIAQESEQQTRLLTILCSSLVPSKGPYPLSKPEGRSILGEAIAVYEADPNKFPSV